MAEKFKLQVVLNYRQQLEDQAQQILTSSLQRQSELHGELQHHQSSLQRHDDELKRRQQDGLTIAEMDLYESQIQHYHRLIESIREKLLRLERQIVAERSELLHAARERQVLEKLKDKQDTAYRQELSRKERVMLDEISLRNKGNK